MKVKGLKHGQYFQCGNIVARYVTPSDNEPLVLYFNDKSTIKIETECTDYFKLAAFWENVEVTPIDFQTAVLLLVKECLQINQYETLEPHQSKATTLPRGQYFMERERVGRVFEDKVFYLQQSECGCWNYAGRMTEPIIPVTIQQAVLFLAQKYAKS
ncbi:MAG: hypothetical protein M0R80_25655 [Proteobacteria bacterium]|jgi:hypothetical protein|nr:hypothetical protein [Pseudomonadota bacterium]